MPRRDQTNRTTYWCTARMPGMSLMRADFTTQQYAPHTHDAFVIAVTELGGAEIANGQSVERVCPPILFVSNPEERQSARMAESTRWVYRSFYVTPHAMQSITHRMGLASIPYFARSMFADADLIRRFGHLHRVLEAGNDPFGADEAIVSAFGMLFNRYGSDGARHERAPHDRLLANRVLEMMQERYDENVGLGQLAAAVGLTSFQLIDLFKRAVGLTPHAYLVQLRLHAACRHLKRGWTLAESALAAGFCDQSALNKHFKRSYGITPLQFRDSLTPR